MKSRWYYLSSIFQIVVGTLAIVAVVILAVDGELNLKWALTLLLAVAHVVMGIIGIKDNRKG